MRFAHYLHLFSTVDQLSNEIDQLAIGYWIQHYWE